MRACNPSHALRAGGLALTIALTTAIPCAHAQRQSLEASGADLENGQAGGAAVQRLRVMLVGSSRAQVEWFSPIVREALAPFRIPIDVEYGDSLPLTKAAASFEPNQGEPWAYWVDLRSPTSVVLYVADARAHSFLVRVLQSEAPATDAVLAEKAREILYASTEGLLSGGELGIATEQPGSAPVAKPGAAPAFADVAVSAERAPARVLLGAYYFGELFSEQHALLHGPGVGFGFAFPASSLLIATQLRVQYGSAEEQSGIFGVDLDVLRGYAQLGFAGAGERWWFASFGAGLDVSHVRPQSLGADALLRESRWSTRGLLRANVEIQIVSAVVLGATADLELDRPRYAGTVGGERTTVLRVYPLRPGLYLGVGL